MKGFILKIIGISAFFVVVGTVVQKIDALFQPDEPTFIAAQNQHDEPKFQFKIIKDVSARQISTDEDAETFPAGKVRLQVSSPEKAFSVKTFRFDEPAEKSLIAKKKIILIKTSRDSATNNKATIE